MSGLRVGLLRAGGIIVNYRCPSRCAHCLYASSPSRADDYIDEAAAGRVFAALRAGGCGSVHVGGGEPLLHPDRLEAFARRAREAGVGIDYVETNSAWHRSPEGSARVLRGLRDAGVGAVMLSVSPFHNEYVPYAKVLAVAEAARGTGMPFFVYQRRFVADMEAADPGLRHPLSEEASFAHARRFGLTMRGRALASFRRAMPPVPLARLLADSGPCAELADTTHFHIDLYGNYVPGLCAGLSIRCGDLAAPLDPDRYPLLTMLFGRGVGALLDHAAKEHGYRPADAYVSKCDLCQDVRAYLFEREKAPELSPGGFYEDLQRLR